MLGEIDVSRGCRAVVHHPHAADAVPHRRTATWLLARWIYSGVLGSKQSSKTAGTRDRSAAISRQLNDVRVFRPDYTLYALCAHDMDSTDAPKPLAVTELTTKSH